MNYSDFNIDIPLNRISGEVYTVCPKCSHDRKKKHVKCLGVNLDKQVWHCNHCQWKGGLTKKTYTIPTWENLTQLPDKVVEWFAKRSISQQVLIDMKVTTAVKFMPQVEKEVNTICFNYFREGQLVNVKYRDAAKNFMLYKGAEKILYNLDGIKDQKEIWIVEGEIDCLTLIQLGIKNSCSVPNGANKKNNNLDYMDNCWQYFEQAEAVYILTDTDEPGNMLADELARRIGTEKSHRVKIDGFKDVNEAYCNGLHLTLDSLKSYAKPYPLLGVYTADNFWDGLLNIRKNGFPKGWKPRPPFGNHVTIHPGYFSIITGIPGHGKSEHLDQTLLELCIDNGLRGAYFSPENWPTELHLIKLVEKISGRNFWTLNLAEVNEFKSWIEDHIFWVYPEDGFNLTNVLNHIGKAVKRYGINWFVIDPWNKLDHQYTGNETKYISEALDQIDVFCKKNNLHGFIVAHPTKMAKDEEGKYQIPNLYSISGSAHFFNKTALGWTVYKKEKGLSEVHIQKVKFKYWGEIGMYSPLWDEENGRYYMTNPDRGNWLKNEIIENNEIPF